MVCNVLRDADFRSTYDCARTNRTYTPNTGYFRFRFQTIKHHLLRLINSFEEGLQHCTIDNHNFMVVSLDCIPIKPFNTNKITLSPRQRANIVVKATGKPNYVVWMRSNIGAVCAAASNLDGLAII